MRPPAPPAAPAQRRPWGALGLIVLVAGLAGLAVWPMIAEVGARLSGGRGVALREAFAPGDPSARFDHGTWDALLREFVDEQGYVDYGRLTDDPRPLDAYLTAIAKADLDALGRDEKLALLLNAYNALTWRTVVDHWPVASLQAIPDGEAGRGRPWVVGGATVTLGELERDWLRGRFREPRVHFALNPGTLGAAPLRREAYIGARLEAQLSAQTSRVFADRRHAELLDDGGVLRLTQVCLWFAGDFQQVHGSLLGFVRAQSPSIDAWCGEHGTPRVLWLDYDWRLNDVSNRPG